MSRGRWPPCAGRKPRPEAGDLAEAEHSAGLFAGRPLHSGRAAAACELHQVGWPAGRKV